MECTRERCRPDVVRACGLVAFAYIAISGTYCAWRRVVASIILVNGLLCHLTQTPAYEHLDVSVNALLVLFFNLTSFNQPYLLLATLISFLIWRLCHHHPERAWLHVLGVQWVGAHMVLHA